MERFRIVSGEDTQGRRATKTGFREAVPTCASSVGPSLLKCAGFHAFELSRNLRTSTAYRTQWSSDHITWIVCQRSPPPHRPTTDSQTASELGIVQTRP